MRKAAHTHMPSCVKMAPDTAAEVVLLLRALVIASKSRSHQDMPTNVRLSPAQTHRTYGAARRRHADRVNRRAVPQRRGGRRRRRARPVAGDVGRLRTARGRQIIDMRSAKGSGAAPRTLPRACVGGGGRGWARQASGARHTVVWRASQHAWMQWNPPHPYYCSWACPCQGYPRHRRPSDQCQSPARPEVQGMRPHDCRDERREVAGPGTDV